MSSRGGGAAGEADPVYQISGARPGLSEDISGRTRRYVISMLIRTVCFPLAVVTEGWVRWMFVAGAVLVPYFAVVIANAGRERVEAPPTTGLHAANLALPPAPVRAPDDVDGFLRAVGDGPAAPQDRPGPTDWERRASA